MAAQITKLMLLFFLYQFVPLHAKNNNLLYCTNQFHHSSQHYFSCTKSDPQKCSTFAVLLTNSYYSSLQNLSSFLGLNRFSIAQANGFSQNTEFLPSNQPLLIPIDCKCSASGFYEAEIMKTAVQGESFDAIAESLGGLTSCDAIKERNPGLFPQNLRDKTRVLVPVKCACPTSLDISRGTQFLISYPVSSGVSVTSLAKQFNVTPQSIITANHKLNEREITSDSLSVLIPVSQKPLLGSLAKPREPSFVFPDRSTQQKKKKKKKARMKKLALCFAVIGAGLGAIIVGVVAFVITQKQKKKQQPSLFADAELAQLSLSTRATSEKKVSFEGSQSTLDGQVAEATTPRSCKIMLETYSLEEVQKATEDFNSHNLIEGAVYHGRVKGKNVAIKSTTSDFLSKVEFFLQDAMHTHPNIMRILGSCVTDGPNSYLVFEYAKNGSLKDWIHGGLAMKSHFIASCSCFLTWKQRLKICLDVAFALQYMHHIMHPIYVHRNIKSRNIFLDEEFSAKLGNFGMARCVEDDTNEKNSPETQFCPRNPSSWTKGYLAPECIKQGIFSPSTDVFSYGVVLLEVLSGKTPILSSDDKDGKEVKTLTEQIKSILGSENVNELRDWMDLDLADNYSFDVAISLANLARSCTEHDPSLRPNAGEIVEKLSRLIEESSVEGDNQQFLLSESSCKPLVEAAASSNNV